MADDRCAEPPTLGNRIIKTFPSPKFSLLSDVTYLFSSACGLFALNCNPLKSVSHRPCRATKKSVSLQFAATRRKTRPFVFITLQPLFFALLPATFFVFINFQPLFCKTGGGDINLLPKSRYEPGACLTLLAASACRTEHMLWKASSVVQEKLRGDTDREDPEKTALGLFHEIEDGRRIETSGPRSLHTVRRRYRRRIGGRWEVNARGRIRNLGARGGGTFRRKSPQHGQRPSCEVAAVASARNQ
jgi:hypothetical protein